MRNSILFMLWIATIFTIGGFVSHAQEQRLEIRNVLLRYEGGQEFGTFAVLVCNIANRPTRVSQIDIEANNVSVQIAVDDFLPRNQCMHYYNPETNFMTFNIIEQGIVSIRVTMDSQVFTKDVMLPSLTTVGANTSFTDHETCLKNHRFLDCLVSIYDTPLGSKLEVKLRTNDYFVIAPRAYEQLMPFYLNDLSVCATNLSTYFGIAVPQAISRRLVVVDTDAEVGAFATIGTDTGIIVAHGTNSTFVDSISWLAEWWARSNDGYCVDPHETTHTIVNNTPIPYWLNEGLATYMEDVSRSHYWTTLPMFFECIGNSFMYEFGGQRTSIRLLNLRGDMYNPNVIRINYYYSGACFWDYIRQNYGDEAVGQIIQRLLSYQSPDYVHCILNPRIYFMRDIVIPIIGVDILAWSEDALGIGELYTGCEY